MKTGRASGLNRGWLIGMGIDTRMLRIWRGFKIGESDNAVPSFVGLKNWRYLLSIQRDLFEKNVRSYEDVLFLNFNFLIGNQELIDSKNYSISME